MIRVIHPTADAELIKSVWTDPRLWDSINDDGAGDPAEFEPVIAPGIMEWLACEIDGQAAGLLLMRRMNFCTWQLHVAFRAEHWGQGIARDAAPEMLRLAFAHTGALKFTASIPVDLAPVWQFVERVGFRREGISPGAWLKRGTLHDVYLYGRNRELSKKAIAA